MDGQSIYNGDISFEIFKCLSVLSEEAVCLPSYFLVQFLGTKYFLIVSNNFLNTIFGARMEGGEAEERILHIKYLKVAV